ncbi:hypothetical protein CHISP_3321 [Chitinispirillum alkaliphilum]|nr:hypothetical protein CHISP_3321 [Chitinispirillum alkaliphilum]
MTGKCHLLLAVVGVLLVNSCSSPTQSHKKDLPDFKIQSLTSPENEISFLIITDQECLAAAQEYANYRHKSSGKPVGVCTYDEVNELFSDPVSPVRKMLSYASESWSIAPRHVFLIGLFDKIHSPTAYDMDSFIADFNGDYTLDVALGRLPTTSDDTVRLYLQKVKDFESRFKGRYLFVADDSCVLGKSDIEFFDFENRIRKMISKYETSYIDTFYLSKYTHLCDTSELGLARKELLMSLNSEPSIVTFFGHHNSQTIFDEDMLESATFNQLSVPNLYISGMLLDNFETPSLARDLLFRSENGAVAILPFTQETNVTRWEFALNRILAQYIIENDKTIGLLMQNSIGRSNHRHQLQLTLLGDPAIKL